jgi:cellulose synthase (UDP-forming)
VRSRAGDVHRLQFVGRQWPALAALSATAFGAGAARWAARPVVHEVVSLAGRRLPPVPVPRERVARTDEFALV